MANKKEKKWCTIIGALAGGIIAYKNSEGKDNQFWDVLSGVGLGAAGGYTFACLFGEPEDTVNYSCFDKKKKRIYEGISFEDRKHLRIAEHKSNGMRIHSVRYGNPKPRSEAISLERNRIRRFQPKFNIQHNLATCQTS